MKNLCVTLLLLAMCCAGCRNLYYSAWEKLGKEKRDLLQSKVQQVRDDQGAAAQQLKDALTRLQELYGAQGTDLEKTYKKLQSDYESSVSKAATVRSRIRQMDQIAHDLFAEWQKEADSIGTASLRQSSLDKLEQTRTRYAALYTTTTRAEQNIEPVLSKFHDYVLYLKHNLNAQAMGTIQTEARSIQGDINKLIADMHASIQEADTFIKATK